MYSLIINPATKRSVSIITPLGQQIVLKYLNVLIGGSECLPLKKSVRFNMEPGVANLTDADCQNEALIGYDEEQHKYCCYAEPNPNIGKQRPALPIPHSEIINRRQTTTYEHDLTASRYGNSNDPEYKLIDFLEITVGIIRGLSTLDPENRIDEHITSIIHTYTVKVIHKVIADLEENLLAEQRRGDILSPESGLVPSTTHLNDHALSILDERRTRLNSMASTIAATVRTRTSDLNSAFWKFLDLPTNIDDDERRPPIDSLARNMRADIYAGVITANEDILEALKLKNTYIPRVLASDIDNYGGDDLFANVIGDGSW